MTSSHPNVTPCDCSALKFMFSTLLAASFQQHCLGQAASKMEQELNINMCTCTSILSLTSAVKNPEMTDDSGSLAACRFACDPQTGVQLVRCPSVGRRMRLRQRTPGSRKWQQPKQRQSGLSLAGPSLMRLQAGARWKAACRIPMPALPGCRKPIRMCALLDVHLSAWPSLVPAAVLACPGVCASTSCPNHKTHRYQNQNSHASSCCAASCC